MPETIKKGKGLERACRIVMTIDVLFICLGYYYLLQAKWQLTSPLVPRSTVDMILADTSEVLTWSSLGTAFFFLAGLWLYFFQLKKWALGFFIGAIAWFEIYGSLLN